MGYVDRGWTSIYRIKRRGDVHLEPINVSFIVALTQDPSVGA